jgi:hypothetical protein
MACERCKNRRSDILETIKQNMVLLKHGLSCWLQRALLIQFCYVLHRSFADSVLLCVAHILLSVGILLRLQAKVFNSGMEKKSVPSQKMRYFRNFGSNSNKFNFFLAEFH